MEKKEMEIVRHTTMNHLEVFIVEMTSRGPHGHDDFELGMILEGTVVSIKEFGAFVEFAPGKEGMVHISKIAKERVEHVEDYLTLGDKVKVKCLGKDKMGRMSFSIKDAK